jgi:hypothetical protein
MTDDRFDRLTKLVSTSTTRRGLLKGAAAVALSGVVARVRGTGRQDADARARIHMACARLGQPCAEMAGTPGSLVCCPHLACDATEHVCCTPSNGSCLADADCCGDDICRPTPGGLGGRCLPLGELGAACLEDADCASGACDAYTATCAAAVCMTGADPETGAPWLVCSVDAASAWLSAPSGSSGLYHAEQICQLLGYSVLGSYGGTCGQECGFCGVGTTSCSAPGSASFDGQGACSSDAHGLILCGTVMWQCLA